ncbi:hypothetical protein [Natrarchaeobius oligotrophus]|uniref:Uncharacterized protein n=1 Tax=Natrarchaeobius chitinivorans TaxID=1679083 RepID=A0A3N6M809_NATCH|nr:hypothetical protein [Natrarchaeobius chitinivorans]RQG99778.1 hypothetical protein EA472_13260 [Natrarchaeobius chitinivorans]
MTTNENETGETDENEHGRDVELAREKTDPEETADEEGLTEEEKRAREREDEEQRRQDIEQKSTQRENDALENANPDHHRDEEPYDS